MRKIFFNSMICFFFASFSLTLADSQKTIFEKSYSTQVELQLHLNIDGGDVKLSRSDDNECKVTIEYDESNCKVDVNYDDKDHQLDVSIDHDNINIATHKKERKSDYAVVRIELPNRSIIDIDSIIRAGELDFQLGDLHIRNLELHSWAGEAVIDFDQPNRIEINRLDIDLKIGVVKILHLGNANFKEADINSEIGELSVDFSGEKLDERAMAHLDLEIGETTIIIPEEIGVKMKITKFLFLSEIDYPHWFEEKGSYYYSENYNKAKKSLYLFVGAGIGEVKIKVQK